MISKAYKVAIIGCAHIGETHMDHILLQGQCSIF